MKAIGKPKLASELATVLRIGQGRKDYGQGRGPGDLGWAGRKNCIIGPSATKLAWHNHKKGTKGRPRKEGVSEP